MDHLLTEARNPASTDLDKLTSIEFVRLMNAEDSRVAPSVGSQADAIARAIDVTAARIKAGGRLVYLGAGTSGRLGVLDAAECPPTFSVPPEMVVGVIAGGPSALTTAVEGAEDQHDQAVTDLTAIKLGKQDVLVGIATSGRTPYVQGGLHHARAVGAFTVGLSCNPDSDLLPLCDLTITPVVGPEVLTGSTRLKAGTATKLVLNTISTGVMVRLGKTFGNLMVDLRATNNKLRARTNRIVRHFTGLSADEADRLLTECDGELKTALVAHRAGLSPDVARARLAANNGRVRVVLDAVGTTPARPAPPVEGAAAALVLGIDGGGSHTSALLARAEGDRWPIIGRGMGGPSNLHAVGVERAAQALDEAIAGAFASAGLERGPVAAACLGLAGAGRQADQAIIQDWGMRVQLAARIDVTSDVALLPAAGTPEGWGVAVVSGTGSIAFGRSPDGRTARAGGWGALLGDEGSAYDLVTAALRAVARATDGRGPTTRLTDRFLARLGLRQPADLIPTLSRGWDRAGLASLAPLVLDAMDSSDHVAAGVADQCAWQLAEAVGSVARMLGLHNAPVPVALSGGCLRGSPGYRQRLLRHLQAMGLRPNPVNIVEEPAEGAVRLAAQMAK